MTNSKNTQLHSAKTNKKDEFYTQLSDIERELKHYKNKFKNKIVFLNCDDPRESNFWRYFSANFEFLGLKKLVSTHYKSKGKSYKLEIVRDVNGDGKINDLDTIKTSLTGNGDFRSDECIALLKDADVVVTNPPFSLFREYIACLIKHKKKFIVVGHQNAITHKDIFPLIKENKLWLGYGFKGNVGYFINNHYDDYAVAGQHKDGMIRVSGVAWYTNVNIKKRHEDIVLYKKYRGNKEEYLTYDNYNAINIDKVKDIPTDYKGAMGVPITFMYKYNPDQFEIIGCSYSYGETTGYHISGKKFNVSANGREIYKRIFIKRK